MVNNWATGVMCTCKTDFVSILASEFSCISAMEYFLDGSKSPIKRPKKRIMFAKKKSMVLFKTLGFLK